MSIAKVAWLMNFMVMSGVPKTGTLADSAAFKQSDPLEVRQ